MLKNIRIYGRRTTLKLQDLELEAIARLCAESGQSFNEFCVDAIIYNDVITNSTAKVRERILRELLDRWEQPPARVTTLKYPRKRRGPRV